MKSQRNRRSPCKWIFSWMHKTPQVFILNFSLKEMIPSFGQDLLSHKLSYLVWEHLSCSKHELRNASQWYWYILPFLSDEHIWCLGQASTTLWNCMKCSFSHSLSWQGVSRAIPCIWSFVDPGSESHYHSDEGTLLDHGEPNLASNWIALQKHSFCVLHSFKTVGCSYVRFSFDLSRKQWD